VSVLGARSLADETSDLILPHHYKEVRNARTTFGITRQLLYTRLSHCGSTLRFLAACVFSWIEDLAARGYCRFDVSKDGPAFTIYRRAHPFWSRLESVKRCISRWKSKGFKITLHRLVQHSTRLRRLRAVINFFQSGCSPHQQPGETRVAQNSSRCIHLHLCRVRAMPRIS
jgi:hypothetical protein